MISSLLAQGAFPDMRDTNSVWGFPSSFSLLALLISALTLPLHADRTCLWIASFLNFTKTAVELLVVGANPNMADSSGERVFVSLFLFASLGFLSFPPLSLRIPCSPFLLSSFSSLCAFSLSLHP